MLNTASLINWGGKFCYAEIKDRYNANFAWNSTEALDAVDYRLNPEWEGSHTVTWSQWEIKPDDEITVVGIQKGNILVYCDDIAGGEVSKNGIITEYGAGEPTNPALVNCAGFSLAVLFAFLGIRPMVKKNKEG